MKIYLKERNMIKVSLISEPNVNAEDLIAFGARSCYQPTEPKIGEKMDIKSRLFDVGHHTTFQHGHYTFFIEGIAIGDLTLGLHLTNVFYNSSQRSGRFCSQMFVSPDFDEIAGYLNYYDLNIREFIGAMDYLASGFRIYNRHLAKAESLARKFIREERPNASDGYIVQNALKIAQEQLRVFIPVILPTALTYTINLSALAALYHTAWSSPLMDLTQQMADLILKKNPNLNFIFSRSERERQGLPMIRRFLSDSGCGISLKPHSQVVSFGDFQYFQVPNRQDLWPIDLLPFEPAFMDNNTQELKTDVEISLATMGQDQRHRTVRRGQPIFTGNFYLPPLPRCLDLEADALALMNKWKENIFGNPNIPLTLACSLAPYGAMVKYRKSASYNALAHEFFKRLCWCTQEEIYHASVQVVEQIKSHLGPDSPLLAAMKPPCAMSGVCGEGKRYCGRDIAESVRNPFTERKV